MSNSRLIMIDLKCLYCCERLVLIWTIYLLGSVLVDINWCRLAYQPHIVDTKYNKLAFQPHPTTIICRPIIVCSQGIDPQQKKCFNKAPIKFDVQCNQSHLCRESLCCVISSMLLRLYCYKRIDPEQKNCFQQGSNYVSMCSISHLCHESLCCVISSMLLTWCCSKPQQDGLIYFRMIKVKWTNIEL